MPTFDTPKPINVTAELYVGNLTVTAEDRADTVVTVNPSNPDDESDVDAAAKTKVDMSGDTLVIKAFKLRDYVSWSKKTRSVDVTVAVPTGSSLSGSASLVNLTTSGRLGSCEYKSGIGNFFVDAAETVRLRTLGDLVVDEVTGDAELQCGTGRLRLERAGGNVTAKNANGPCLLGEVGGNARVRSSNGEISVERIDGDLDAATALGVLRVGEVRGGAVELKTPAGAIEIGVREGVAAWVDARADFGSVRNHLDGTGEPGPGEPTVRVRARTSFGDIVIRRS